MRKILRNKVVLAMMALLILMGSTAEAKTNEPIYIKVLNYKQGGVFPEYLKTEGTESPNYYKYTNRRFGFSAYIPAELDGCRLPRNGDGAMFTGDSAPGITVSGSYNTRKVTTEKAYQEELKLHPEALYHDCGEDWYVISYQSERYGYIVYQKCFVSPSYVNTLSFMYPGEAAEYFAPMIETIEENFIPGWK